MALLADILERICVFNFALFLLLVPYSRRYVKIFLIIGCISWFLLNIFRHKKDFYKRLIPSNPLNLPIFIFALVSCFTVIFSIDPYHSQKILFSRFILYFLFFWIGCGLVKDSRRNTVILAGAFMVSFIFGFGGVWDFFSNGLGTGRIWTVYGQKVPFNMLPLYLTYFIPFVFAFFIFSRNPKIRIFSFINLGILTAFLIWQQCRSAFVAVAVSLLAVSLLKSRKTFLKSAAILILAVLFLSIVSSQIREKIKTIPYPEKWSFRVPLYKSAVAMFLDHPVSGVGLGMYEKMIKTPRYQLPGDYPAIESTRDMYLHAHNVYCEISAETGVIGLSAFIWLFWVFFRNVFRKSRRISGPDRKAVLTGLAGVVAATLVFAVGLTTITVGTNETMMFWFLFGMAAGLISSGEIGDKRAAA